MCWAAFCCFCSWLLNDLLENDVGFPISTAPSRRWSSSLSTELRKLQRLELPGFQGSLSCLCGQGGRWVLQLSNYSMLHSTASSIIDKGGNSRSQFSKLPAVRCPEYSRQHAQICICTVTFPGDMSSIPQVLHRTAKPVAVAEFIDAVQATCSPRFPGARGRQGRPVGTTSS